MNEGKPSDFMRTAIIPIPLHIENCAGEFPLTRKTAVFFDPTFADPADLLGERLRLATGFPFPLHSVPSPEQVVRSGNGEEAERAVHFGPIDFGFTQEQIEGGHFCLILDTSLECEEYRIGVEPQGARLYASASTGMVHAVHTLFQLLPPAVFSSGPRIGIGWDIPCVNIHDKPQHEWRGAMLDCVRHFIPVEEIKKFVEVFALHHFNILQLHLNDDQGWRIEIKSLPRLVDVGGIRMGTHRGHRTSGAGFDGRPHGGFYTQEELRELVIFSERRGITLVPEIDLPGHSTAALAAYPHLASGEPPIAPACEFGILSHTVFPSEENLEFLAPVYEETMALFPGPFFHIGGDEVLTDRWLADSRTPDLLRTYGLNQAMDLQHWFTRRLHALAARHGKQIVGWDEILHDELPGDAIVMSWRERPATDIVYSRRTIQASHTHTYFDYYQSADIKAEPLAIGGITPLSKVYGYDPLAGVSTKSSIFGVQGQLWTEYQSTSHEREYMAFPRFCALAEVAWSDPAQKNWPDFQNRLTLHLRRLDVLGITYRGQPFDTDCLADSSAFRKAGRH